jgi:outer membrane protein assembly factor BamB
MDGKRSIRLYHSLILVGYCALSAPLHAQFLPPPSLPRDNFSVELDSIATKQIGTLQDYLRAGQYPEAVELLLKLAETRSEKFLELSPGRYVPPRSFAEVMAANLPPEGLRLYRAQVDPLAQRILDRKTDQEAETRELWLRILHQGAAGSLADEAVNRLAQLAWERGEIASARSLWESLIPCRRPVEPPHVPSLFAYPDSDLDLAEIRAKLILCSILLDDFTRADRELAAFRELHPESQGELRGRKGKWIDLLVEFDLEAETWPKSGFTPRLATFAGSETRNGFIEGFHDLLPPVWSDPVVSYAPLFRGRRPKSLEPARPEYFPVIEGDRIFWADDESVHACRLSDGKPLWPGAGDEKDFPCRIYRAPISERPIPANEALQDAAAFRDLIENNQARSFAGLPQFTLTLSNGRLYARLRTRLSPLDTSSGQGEPSRLVCLDIETGEGKLVWEVDETAWKEEEILWRFEGSPLIHGDKLYVGLNSTGAKRISAVACLRADTGERLWIRRLGELQGIGFSLNERLSRGLVTIAEGALFYETGGGGLVSLDLETGEPRWIVKVPSGGISNTGSLAPLLWDRMAVPVWDRGIVYVLGHEGKSVVAVDGSSGLIVWIRELGRQVQWILGVSGDRVIVSGERLWALDRISGQVAWTLGSQDTELQGFGRGLLSHTEIYWPLREEILVVDQTTGGLKERIPLNSSETSRGGHLSATGGALIIAQPDRLTLYPTLPSSNSLSSATGGSQGQ